MIFKTFKLILISLALFSSAVFANFPAYVELNVGESVKIDNYPEITLVSKRVVYFDSTHNRIGAADITLKVGNETVVAPVGYESPDVIARNARIGAELVSDYEKDFTNQRFHLIKDARIRISNANEPLMPKNSHVYPLDTPWNSGFRTQGWLCVCFNINILEGNEEMKAQRYHDGWDIGVWEGQLVRSVCTGTVVSPDDYPDFIETGLLYNKNDARVGPNPFLVKPDNAPVLYYYTHMSGLARDFKAGDIIKKGEPLGYASSRGSSGGWYHLHFSIIHLEKKVHVNPYPYLKEWYEESQPQNQDFMNEFDVYYHPELSAEKEQFEQNVVANKIEPTRHFRSDVHGVVHVREAVAKAPHAGLNHVIFYQFAVLKGQFKVDDAMDGELWFGHTGKARVYLNGTKVYDGENNNPYHRSKQPFQWDSVMMQVQFNQGLNEVIIAIEQTNPFWSFSIRPRNRLGIPLN
ncbi:M23 family metallopeptidase [candidate division KSB1 bacterium]|nr:M23 family metallopeptidase [candidate division KSB1 bacterium]